MRVFLISCIAFASIPLTSFADFGFTVSGENLTPNNPPVLFLPGFQGSRLYVEQNNSLTKAWEPLTNSRLSLLEMNKDGSSVNNVRVGTVIDAIDVFEGVLFKFNRIYGISITEYLETYPDTLLETIDAQLPSPLRLEDFLITADGSMTWYTYPYDWRYDVLDIVENGTLRTDGEVIYLDEVVKKLYEVAQEPIHIVAHSNGGLLARALMIHLAAEGHADKIASLTLVGSPQSGTPKTIAALLHGYEQGRFFGIVTNGNTSRKISKNMPGAYALLPFETYFKNESEPVVYKKTSLPEKYEEWFTSPINTFEKFSRFIENIPEDEDSSKLNVPQQLNKDLFKKALETHRKLHSWEKPGSLIFRQVGGTGLATLSALGYEKDFKLICPAAILTCFSEQKVKFVPKILNAGDDTVIQTSASFGAEIEKIILDLKNIQNQNKDIGHATLIKDPEILSIIENIIKNEIVTSEFIVEESSAPSELISAISVHSPVLLSVTDGLGNKTSIEKLEDTDIWQITEDIPGSFVEFVGEGKYIFLPSGNYSIEVEGIDSGSFDLKLSEIKTDGTLELVDDFQNIPVTEKTVAETSSSVGGFSELNLDLDGDNATDFNFSNNSENSESIKLYLKDEFASLPLRKTLHGAIDTYFELLENEVDKDKRATYVHQLERIIKFLEGRYITQDTATNWTALVQNLL